MATRVRVNPIGEPELPTRIDAFDLGQVVGEGGMATVVSAVHRPSGRTMAVKLLEARVLDSSHDAARFLAEARAMATLRHPRIARVYGVGREGPWYWYAMPLLNRGSLKDHVEAHGAVPEARALELIDGVLDGLIAVHDAGLVHRDVKARNVMLDRRNDPVLVDFGLARHPEGTVPYRTMAEIGMGSPGYTAPEQRIDASSVDHRADVFSTGALLAFLLTGKRPDGLALPRRAQPGGVLDGVPDHLRALVERSTSYEPEDRHSTASAMQLEVRQALAPHGPRWWRKLKRTFAG